MNSKIILTLVFCGSLVPTSPLVHAARWGGGVLSVGAAYHAAATLSDERDEIEDELSMLEARRDKMPEGSSRFLVDRRIRAKQRELNRITKKIQIFYVAALASGAISAVGWMQGGSEESGGPSDSPFDSLFGGRNRSWVDTPSNKRVSVNSFDQYVHQIDEYSKSEYGEELLPAVPRTSDFIKIIDVAGDGHCGYRSVSRGLLLAGKDLPRVDSSQALTQEDCVRGQFKYFEGTLKEHLLEQFNQRVDRLKKSFGSKTAKDAIANPACGAELTSLQLLAESGGIRPDVGEEGTFTEYLDSLKLKERFRAGVKGELSESAKWADNTILAFLANLYNMPLALWQPAHDDSSVLVLRSIHFPDQWIVGDKNIKKAPAKRGFNGQITEHARYNITSELCTSQAMVHIFWANKNHYQSVEVTKL